MAGVLIGIARKSLRRGPVETLDASEISVALGIEGDRIGSSSTRRKVTVLRAEDWAATCAEIQAELPWTTRRANLLVEGLPLLVNMRQRILRIGGVILQITGETEPCSRMGEAHIALPDALSKAWRGGVTCQVNAGGRVCLNDPVIFE
jgi:MOSC domain-containing protein YiiM